MCSLLWLKPSSLRPPQRSLAAALQEDRGDLFSTISVENRESSIYRALSRYTRTGAPIREARGCPLRAWAREGRVHPPLLLFLLLTNLPLECVAPTGGYVGDLQIDRLVYELYGLTDEEITIVEEGSQTP